MQSWNDDRLDELDRKVEVGFAKTDERFRRIDERFEEVDRRFDKVDKRFDKVEGEIKNLETSLRAEISANHHQLEARFDRMQQTIITVGGGLIGVMLVTGTALIATQL